MSKHLIAAFAATAMLSAGAFAQHSGVGAGGVFPDGSGSNVSGDPFLSTAFIGGTGAEVITNVWIEFNALAHTWVGDMTMTLTHPNTTTTLHILMRPGRGSASTFGFSSDFSANNSYTFADSGVDLFAVAPPAVIDSGVYRSSTNNNPPETNLDPYVYTPTSFAGTFGGMNADGAWTLEVRDWAGTDTGSMAGWTLRVDTAVPEPGTFIAIGIGLAGLALARRRK